MKNKACYPSQIKEYDIMKLGVLSKMQYDKQLLQFYKSPNILYTRELQTQMPKIFNENNMTTLNNYLEKNNALIFFSYIPSDMFHNTKMTVLKKVSYEEKAMALNLKSETRDDFVNSLRTIYTRSAEIIKQLYKNL